MQCNAWHPDHIYMLYSVASVTSLFQLLDVYSQSLVLLHQQHIVRSMNRLCRKTVLLRLVFLRRIMPSSNICHFRGCLAAVPSLSWDHVLQVLHVC